MLAGYETLLEQTFFPLSFFMQMVYFLLESSVLWKRVRVIYFFLSFEEGDLYTCVQMAIYLLI